MRQLVVLVDSLGLWAGAALAQSANAQPSDQPSDTPSAQPSPAQQQAVEQNLKDVHFAFDRYDLSDQDRQVLRDDANWLKANPGVTVSIAGNADERGSIIYNLVLSQRERTQRTTP